MTANKAKILAEALGGKVVQTMPQSRMNGVALTRADGKYALIEEDAGAVYFDEHACWVGYHTLGDDARGVVDAEEWIEWNGSEKWARNLSMILGSPEYWHSGGGIWVVLFTRTDGRFAVIGAEGADIYQSKDHWERYFEAGQPGPEYLSWVRGVHLLSLGLSGQPDRAFSFSKSCAAQDSVFLAPHTRCVRIGN